MPPKTARGPKKRTSQERIPKTSRLTGEADISGTFKGPGFSVSLVLELHLQEQQTILIMEVLACESLPVLRFNE